MMLYDMENIFDSRDNELGYGRFEPFKFTFYSKMSLFLKKLQG